MSQKSWDKRVGPTGEAFPGTFYAPDSTYPARIVEWPEGAPDRSEVPQAGDKMVTDGGYVYTVQSGIPYRYEHEWYVRVYYGDSKDTVNKRLSDLVAWSPPPPSERTYTEAQIRDTYGAIFSSVDGFMSDLRHDHDND